MPPLLPLAWPRIGQLLDRAVRPGPSGFPPAGRAPGAGIFLLLLCGPAPTLAQSAPEDTATSPCVVVDIAGHRAGNLDCAAAALEAAARTAQTRARAGFEVPDARAPDVVTGVASRSATRQRLGTNFGTSVRPARPHPPVYANPIGSRR